MEGDVIAYYQLAGVEFKFVDMNDICEDNLKNLGAKSVLGNGGVDWYSLLLYAPVADIPELGKIYILEKGSDFLIYKKYPSDFKNTALYDHYLFACEHEYAQMVQWDVFEKELLERHAETGLGHMYQCYNSEEDLEITEWVPNESFNK